MHGSITHFRNFLSLLILCSFVFTVHVIAQPSLNLKRITVDWPTITLVMQAYCGSTQRYDLSEQNFTLKENGKTITPFTVSCLEPNTHCCMSTSIVVDVNTDQNLGSPSPIDITKAGVKAFVDSMQSGCDQAAIISYGTNVTLEIPMTFNKDVIKQVADALAANGNKQACIVDAARKGLEEIVNHGTQPCKALIVARGGDSDDGPCQYEEYHDVLLYAQQHNIRIYCICYGICIDEDYWQTIANETGGKYYKFYTLNDIVNSYLDIYKSISRHFDECEIQYTTSSCPDGQWKNIDLTLKQLSGCSGTDTKSNHYKVLDSSKFSPIIFSLGSGTVQTNYEVIIPFNLDTPIDGPIYPSTFIITFNKQKLTFVDVVKTGFLWYNKRMVWYSMPNGVQIVLQDTVMLSGNGILCGLKFRANNLINDDADIIKASSTSYISPCTIAQFQNGIVTIIAAYPKLDSCSITSPDNIVFDLGSKSYSPSPVPIDVSVTNTGKLEAKNLKAEIQFDNSFLHLLTGSNPQNMNPNILPPNNSSTAHWEFEPLPRAKNISSAVTVTITSDNHTPVICTKNISVDSIPPILQIQLDPITVKYNRNTVSYSPMPVPLTAHVTNVGMAASRNTKAEIILPLGLSLDASEQNKMTKFLNPIHLPNLAEGIAIWNLTHPITFEAQRYTITVRSWSDNADQVEASIDIIIPAAEGPMLVCDSLTIPPQIKFDSLTKNYLQNPFTIKYSAINSGGFDLDSARATLVLPSGFILDPPTQNFTQYFNPVKIIRWNAQLPSNTVSWQVRALPRYGSMQDMIQIKINGKNSFNQNLEEYVCSKNIFVDAFGKTKTNCSVVGIDSIKYSRLYGLTPNPFTLDFTITNESSLPITIAQVNIRHAIQGLQLELLTPTISDSVLTSGASLQIKAKMRASELKMIRTGDITLEYTTKESVQEMVACIKNIYIDSIMPSPFGNYYFTSDLIDSIRYDCVSENYVPDTLTAKATITNNGEKTIDSLQIKLQLPDALEFIHPADSMRDVPTVSILSSENIEWQLHVARYIPSDTSVVIRYELFRNAQPISIKDENLFIGGMLKPNIIVSASKLNFQFVEEDTTTKQSRVQITSSDHKKYLWEATTLKPWVTVNPAKGFTNDSATIKLNPKNLQVGKHTTSISFVIIENCALKDVQVECIIAPATSVSDGIKEKMFYLGQNYPNPFTSATTIDLTPALSYEERVLFKIYDIFGREVLDLSKEVIGNSSLVIRNSQLPSQGIYFYRLTIGNQSQTKMMIMIK